jgi:TonB family protein
MSSTDDAHDDSPLAPVEASPPAPAHKSSRKLSKDDVSALSWLGRWLGIPFLIVIAAFYAEPLFRSDRIEVVPQVTYQRVEPYPFPKDAQTGPSLAPPEIPRTAPPPTFAPLPANPLPAAEIVATPIDQPSPSYPRRALESGREGVVRLRITIGADGNVTNAEVIEARPKGWFEAAAIDAVKRWRYRPPGRTLSTEAEIEFKLR